MADSYREAGVDIEAGARAVTLIKELAAGATRPEVRGGIGGFAGAFEISPGRYLVSGTDGVGTKCEIARATGKLDTVGIDLVAMCVDDIVCTGAEPLFFLDYIAVGRVVAEEIAALVGGIAKGCADSGAALLGGETAEHPGVMESGQFDLAGFVVGVVEEDAMMGPERVETGDTIVALASSGLHSNGYSLVRKVLLEGAGLDLAAVPESFSRPLGEELLEPTRIYAPLILDLNARGLLHAAAHITGGGLYENVPRALPAGCGAEMDTARWTPPPVFDLVQRLGEVERDEMYSTFNMGVGMVCIAPPEAVANVVTIAREHGCAAWPAGAVVEGEGLALR